ncbi:MAG: glycoside hydrolase family 127 protein [Treponema sp.]|nr:glycoside hydrolase family 127 protein [Treponema sp.]
MKTPLPLNAIHIDDLYWNRYTRLIPEKVIPYQWEVLNDRVPGVPPSNCLRNFRIAAGEEKGERGGMVFQDSDAAKWLEAVAYSLACSPDPVLEKNADGLIALIGRAQEKDGYLNTYFSLKCPEGKWKNLTEGHELYCAGHFIEAAAAYFETTGKTRLLEIMCRFADLICATFGTEPNKLHGYPGHPEIELALVRLYRVTGVRRYLDLAKYFIDTRGSSPNYFIEEMKRPDFKRIFAELSRYDPAYSQSHVPVREQDTAEGHAVRAMYLFCAMADLAQEYNDGELLERCRILWDNVVQKRMYITGSIGSSGILERFTVDYDLPNDSNYSETCASIGLAMFGLRMNMLTADASYFDTVERVLYNTVRSGISLEGDRYFYVNPLEVWPQTCIENSSRAHIKPVRQKWFDCACCPTNLARTLTGLGKYIYLIEDNELYINLFIRNNAEFKINGETVNISIDTDYPKTGHAKIKIKSGALPLTLNIRIPGFIGSGNNFIVCVNGKPAAGERINNYLKITGTWNNDEVTLNFPVEPRLVYSNPKVHLNCGKAAIARGPEIYCLEEIDNGKNLAALSLDTNSPLQEFYSDKIPGGIMVIKACGKRLIAPEQPDSFGENFIPHTENFTLTAVPYGVWGNRNNESEPGEMLVWIRI